MDRYQKKLRSLLSPGEINVLAALSSPIKVQDYLDSFPVNVLGEGQHTLRSPRQVLNIRRAHCMEGALLAAACLAYHGRQPWLMDLRATDYDLDHVLALFKEDGLWGAISKTNHPVLRYRDPVYRTVRELAMSYVHEYFMGYSSNHRGKKTLRAYSKPFNLRQYSPERWITSTGNLDWIAEELDRSPHFPVMTPAGVRILRNASDFEIRAMDAVEWSKRGNKNRN